MADEKKKFVIGDYKVPVPMTPEDMDGIVRAVRAGGEIQVIDDDWSTKKYAKFKEYTPASLIDAANFYYNQQPQDLIQCAEKLWLAAVFALKKIYSVHGVHITSHKAMKVMCIFALHVLPFDDSSYTGYVSAWESAEECYRYSYGKIGVNLATFNEWKKNVEEFVDALSSVNTVELGRRLPNYLKNHPKEIGVEQTSGSALAAGIIFRYNYRIY